MFTKQKSYIYESKGGVTIQYLQNKAIQHSQNRKAISRGDVAIQCSQNKKRYIYESRGGVTIQSSQNKAIQHSQNRKAISRGGGDSVFKK